MTLSLDIIEELAPDQASLNAAKKLLKPAKWPMKGQSMAVNTIWGQCQGSGANPYHTMVDVINHGYKCTCPSRKFPCKHVLALMWQFSDDEASFTETEPPEWVNDWLGRRRKTTKTSTTTGDADSDSNDSDKPKIKKDIHASEEAPQKQLSPEEQAKKDAAAAKRAEKLKAATDTSLKGGLIDFQSWVDDQLRTGIGRFLKDPTERCRQIAARMVDAKATALASRIDELPAKLAQFPTQQKPSVVFKELGQLILLSEALLTNPDDADARRAIATTENRDKILSIPADSPNKITRSGIWQNIGEKVVTRKDGLISHATWLLRVGDVPASDDASDSADNKSSDNKKETTSTTQASSNQESNQENNQENKTTEADISFALLLDYYPASAGKREVGLGIGSSLVGTLAFYPSRVPQRAFIMEHKHYDVQNTLVQTATDQNLWQNHQQHLAKLPWAENMPQLLPAGRIAQDKSGRYWWQSTSKQNSNQDQNAQALNLPLYNQDIPPLVLGCELEHAFILWDGNYAELLSVVATDWGVMAC